MCDANTCNTPCSFENDVKKLENENEKLNEKFDWLDKKMKEETALYNQLVANYYGSMVKYKECKEQLERTNVENARFKVVAQTFTDKIEESICSEKDLDTSSIYCINDLNDPIMILEESYQKLIDMVCALKNQMDTTAAEVTVVQDQLAKSSETESCLRACLENLTVLNEEDLMRRDRVEAELRAAVKHLTAELEGARETQVNNEKAAQLKVVLNELLVEVKKQIVNSNECMEELHAKNAKLVADLVECREKALATEEQLFTARMAVQEANDHARMLSYRDGSDYKFAANTPWELDDDNRQTPSYTCTPPADDRLLSFNSRSTSTTDNVNPSLCDQSCSTDVVVAESCDEKPSTRMEWNVNWLLKNTLKRYGSTED